MKNQNCCEFCSYFIYDEEIDMDVCAISIDEDEIAKTYSYSNYSCPYFNFYNEYKTVNKQI